MSGNIHSIWWGLALMATLCQCQKNQSSSAEEAALFLLLGEAETGIGFNNTITPNEAYNLLDFEYLYNGGGVGVGDFDKNGLPDLVFTGNMVKSEIYLNQGNLQFENITQSSGFDTEGKWCTGISIIDINQDGYDDIYLSVGGAGKQSIYPNLLFINQGDLTFKEEAAAYGLADANESNQALFFDYDKDGDLDMYLLNGGGFEKSAVAIRPFLTDGSGRNTDKLYQNNFSHTQGHPVFTDVSVQAGISLEGFGLGVGMIDANQDSWPDIYVSNDYLSRDYLYINNQDGTFSEEASTYFNHLSHFSMGNDIGDVNNDGYMDIITLDMLPESHYRKKMMFGPNQYDRFYQAVKFGYGYQYMRNMLQLGQQDHSFSEIGQLAGIDQTDWSWSPLIADFDNDGYQDIYITNGYGKDITDLDYVKFRKDAHGLFAKPEEVREKMIKSLEYLPAIKLPNYAYRNNGNGTFGNSVAGWGLEQSSISNGAVYVDLDRDGDLELVANNMDQPAFIYKNTQRERDSIGGHYLQVNLQGDQFNAIGTGARVTLSIGSQKQVRYQQAVRGFQSTVTTTLHFGLGENQMVDSIIVVWPDGKSSVLSDVSSDQTITVSYEETAGAHSETAYLPAYLNPADLISFKHQETASSGDFQAQPLLLHGFSNQGPGIAVGDINNDHLDDVFIGGAYGQPARIYRQTATQTFVEETLPTTDYEDLGALFFDFDNDQDLDLYVVSGGSERYEGHVLYQDRIYLNDGKGAFTYSESALPPMLTSTSMVAGGDYDQDGDIDLFIGGRVVPGKYPLRPQSYLLENKDGKFQDVTDQVCPSLKSVGMITAAIWTDFNNDQRQDLIVVGEMTPITLFRNEGDQLRNISDEAGLGHSTGMWNSIASGDFDNDGDTDYVVGNIGLNTPFNWSEEHPLNLHYSDFDQNGSIDPLFSVYEEGAYHLLPSLDLLTSQLPAIKKKFLHYRDYAASTTDDILQILEVSSLQTLKCENQSSMLLENQGGNHFSLRELPLQAQIAPTKGILIEDLNLDGLLDIILVGNDYNTEVVSGNYDASRGLVLINEGHLRFNAATAAQSGLSTNGDARSLVKLALGEDKILIIIGENNGTAVNYLLSRKEATTACTFQPGEVSAVLEDQDGNITKLEYQLGGGYLSQQSRKFWVPSNIQKVSFQNSRGHLTRELNTQQINRNI